MCQHNIFLANSYNKGKRVALDIVFPDINSDNMESYQEKLISFTKKLLNELGKNTALTTHTIRTKSNSWQSVVEADSFFDDVLIAKDMNEFVSLIKDGNKLTSMDFKLLVYFLIGKNKVVFVDREDVYKKIVIGYRNDFQKDLFDIDNSDNKLPEDEIIEKMGSVVIDKILSSENGFDKFRYVLKGLHNITKSPLFV